MSELGSLIGTYLDLPLAYPDLLADLWIATLQLALHISCCPALHSNACLPLQDPLNFQPGQSSQLIRAKQALEAALASPAVHQLEENAQQTSVTQHLSIIKQALFDSRAEVKDSQLLIAVVQKIPLRLRNHPGSLIWAGIHAG